MIRGQKRALEKRPSVKANIKAAIHNRFDIEVVDAKSGEVKQKAQAFNVICERLWTYMFSTSSDYRKYFNYIHYGTGQGTPSKSDTALFAFGGSLAASGETYSLDRENGVLSFQKTATILESVAVDQMITEVGIAQSSSSNTLCTHAMLQDMNGNQISILKTGEDIIKIYATIFVHYRPEGYDNGAIRFFPDVAVDVAFGGNNYNLFSVLVGAVQYPPSWLVCCYGAKNNPTYQKIVTKGAIWSYDLTNKKMIASLPRLAASANESPYTDSGLSPSQTTYLDFSKIYLGATDKSPELMCDITDQSKWFSESVIGGEAVGTGDGATVDFKTKFGYVSECEVLVDGAPATGVVVDYNQSIGKASQAGDCVITIKSDGTPILSTNGSSYVATGEYGYVENVDYLTRKVVAIWGFGVDVYASNDLVSWENTGMVFPNSGTAYRLKVDVPENYQQSRYFRVYKKNSHGGYGPFVADGMDENIHFTTPPPAGAVITANYRSKTIAKDENHVFDFSIEFTIGEYTEN